MNNIKKSIDHSQNMVAGAVKEVAGRITGNEQLELEGKLQASKADLKKALNVTDKIEEIKEKVAEGINDRIDMGRKKQCEAEIGDRSSKTQLSGLFCAFFPAKEFHVERLMFLRGYKAERTQWTGFSC